MVANICNVDGRPTSRARGTDDRATCGPSILRLMRQCPCADFAVFLPFGRKAHGARRYRTYISTPAGFYTKELPGPSGIEQWKALLILQAITMSTAVAYEFFVKKLDRLCKGCWRLVVQADSLRAHASTQGGHGDGPGFGRKSSTHVESGNPWEAVFRKLMNDSDFWSEQVHVPANA